ncbi:TPA: DUF262 domain-containing protein [Morganella morganii]
MNFQAEPVTINTLLSVNKQYFIPRYQRNFSWTKENIDELWYDLLECISCDNGEYSCEEYFIGTLVLAGRDDSFEVEIVDGQQRLTVITMFLSAICRALNENGEVRAATSTFGTYIKGTDRRGEDFAKLDKKSESNYFCLTVQDLQRHIVPTESPEDEVIDAAFTQINKLVSKPSIKKFFNISGSISNKLYINLLNKLSDLILDHLKVIRVNVINNDDAYTIFEILNARGINLSPVDLIKNKVLQEWSSQYPMDFAKEKWNGISSNLSSRDINISIEDYFIHQWTTKFTYTSKRNLYKAFKKQWIAGEFTAENYLIDLFTDSEMYIKLASPLLADWPQADQREIYNSLLALKLFNVSIMRSFLLSLFKARSRGIINQSKLIDTLNKIENFHFMFNAICSLRPSGLDGLYAKYARRLGLANNSRDARDVINGLLVLLDNKKPTKENFVEKFSKLNFLNSNTSHKKLIQYIFTKHERNLRGSNEFEPRDLSLEHIISQSNTIVTSDIIGSIGNLLPMGQEINGDASNVEFSRKKTVYQRSDYRLVSTFLQDNPQDTWGKENILERTKNIAELSYDTIWSNS